MCSAPKPKPPPPPPPPQPPALPPQAPEVKVGSQAGGGSQRKKIKRSDLAGTQGSTGGASKTGLGV